MPDPNWLWLIPVVGFVLLEVWGLHSRTDRAQPLTYWIRHALGLKGTLGSKVHSLGWWLGAAVLAWLVVHFLIEHG